MKLNTEFMIEAFKASLLGIPVTLAITAVSLMISIPLALLMAVKKLFDKRICVDNKIYAYGTANTFALQLIAELT